MNQLPSKRWYLDTEFDEDGYAIHLISIALVSETGDEYYAVCSDGWQETHCNDWVLANVVTKLPTRESAAWKPRAQIANEIRAILLPGDSRPEIWAYFADYDWVALCQLFGRMVDLPKGMPMYCLDLKQEMHRLHLSKSDLPVALSVPQANAHDALADARWNRELHRFLGVYVVICAIGGDQ